MGFNARIMAPGDVFLFAFLGHGMERMVGNGASMEVAMQVLGHSTAQVNQRHYTGTLAKQQEAAVNGLPSIG